MVVIAYYSGRPTQIDSFEVEKLTHIIFSFCHLQGDRLAVTCPRQYHHFQANGLKARNPDLKVLLSLGGWGDAGPVRSIFSSSWQKDIHQLGKRMLDYFGADGIDLDWEYPVIAVIPIILFPRRIR